jgi:hypothetical protein
MATRSILAGELTKLRASGDWSRLFLGFPATPTVAAGTVSAAPASNDQVGEAAWTHSIGLLADVKSDMTALIGSTAGAADKGVVRIRKVPTSIALYIGETSEIEWAAGLHVTIIRDFGIWARHVRTPNGTTVYMDWDIAYSDQHSNPDPVVNMGPDVVLWLTGASVSIQFDASGSFVISGSIASHSWTAPGAASITGGNTATPTIEFDAAGTYWVYDTVTTAAGKSFTGCRLVLVYDDENQPVTDFELGRCSGDLDGGGWTFDITMYSQAGLSQVRDRARVILFSRDWYQGVEGSLGPVAGRENIICQGWIVGESIQPDPDGGMVTFKIEGPAHWIKLVPAFPSGLEDTDFADNGGGAPNRWTEMQDLTTTKVIWHFLHWRSTFTRVADVTILTDARQVAQAPGTGENLWEQLVQLSTSLILAKPCCDQYGSLYVDMIQQFMTQTARDALPVVVDLTEDDRAVWSFDRKVIPEAYKAEVSGVYFSNGVSAPVGAISPGNVPRFVGRQKFVFPELVMGSQSEALELAGWVAGSGSGEIGPGEVDLAQNNRFMDITPNHWIRSTIAASDSPRGVALANHRFVTKAVNHSLDQDGFLETIVELEGEGIKLPAVAMEFPGEGEPPIIPPEELPDPFEPPEEPPPPPPEPGDTDAVVATASDVRTTGDLDVGSPTWVTEL